MSASVIQPEPRPTPVEQALYGEELAIRARVLARNQARAPKARAQMRNMAGARQLMAQTHGGAEGSEPA